MLSMGGTGMWQSDGGDATVAMEAGNGAMSSDGGGLSSGCHETGVYK